METKFSGKSIAKASRFTTKSMNNKGKVFTKSGLGFIPYRGTVTEKNTPPIGRGISYGPRVLGLAGNVILTSGPGEPPANFVGATTSLSEWYLYWALMKLLGPSEEGQWGYQVSMMGGRSNPGGAVVDFVLFREREDVGIRVQTYRFHQNAPQQQQAHDSDQLGRLFRDDFIVIDVYEGAYIDDPTGQAALQVMLEAINGQWRLDPLTSGLTIGTG